MTVGNELLLVFVRSQWTCKFMIEGNVLMARLPEGHVFTGPTFSSSLLGKEVLKLKQNIVSSASQCP